MKESARLEQKNPGGLIAPAPGRRAAAYRRRAWRSAGLGDGTETDGAVL